MSTLQRRSLTSATIGAITRFLSERSVADGGDPNDYMRITSTEGDDRSDPNCPMVAHGASVLPRTTFPFGLRFPLLP